MKINKIAKNITKFIFLCLFGSLFLYPEISNAQKDILIDERDVESGVSLTYRDTLILPSFVEFDLPVLMRPASRVSAIYTGFYYPDEFLEIDSVIVKKGIKGYHYGISDSLFILTWSDIKPVGISENDTLMVLKMKALDLSSLDETIRLELYEQSEFADSAANILDGITLEIPEIYFLFPDPEDTIYGTSVRIYPNPFKDHATVDISLKYESEIAFSLFTPEGIEIRQWPQEIYSEGIHQVFIYGADYAKGTYLLRFALKNQEGEFERVFKIISLR